MERGGGGGGAVTLAGILGEPFWPEGAGRLAAGADSSCSAGRLFAGRPLDLASDFSSSRPVPQTCHVEEGGGGGGGGGDYHAILTKALADMHPAIVGESIICRERKGGGGGGGGGE